MNWFSWMKMRKLFKLGLVKLELCDEYPIIETTEEQKKQLCNATMQAVGKPLVMTFKICQLENFMWGTFYNEPTDEYFELTFKKVDPKTWKPPATKD